MAEGPADITDDAFVGGRLRLWQLRSGHRAGHDAILLAAATAALPGQTVVDFGAGVGTAGLALASRVNGIALWLLELDPGLADLARKNAAANGLPADVRELDIAASAGAFDRAGLPPDSADVVVMNPPFTDAVRHRASPDAAREVAHVATATTLQSWVHAARRVLKSGGVLTLIWRADGLADVLAALDRGFGSIAILPVHSDPAQPAIRIIVRAAKGGRAPLAVMPAIALRDADRCPDPYMEKVLAGEAVLSLARI
ncbi:methyltransferase [soil metagenome]